MQVARLFVFLSTFRPKFAIFPLMNQYRTMLQKSLLVLTAVVLSHFSFGQTQSLGLTGGANVSDVFHSDFLESTDYRFAYNGGISYRYSFENLIGFGKINLGADLLYFQQGFNSNVSYLREDEFQLVVKDTQFNFEYLMLPIKGGLQVGNNIYGFVNIGVAPAFLIKTEYELPEEISYSEDGPVVVDDTENANRYDLAAIGELGGGCRLFTNWDVYITAKYQRGLLNVATSDYFPHSSINHHSISLNLGIAYTFARETTENE